MNSTTTKQPQPPQDINPTPTKKTKTKENNSNPHEPPQTFETYFTAVLPYLNDRFRTSLQLEITDLSDPTRIEHVVVTGASDMKKIHQLLAYLTGMTSKFEYHSQKGRYMKGCRFELNLPDDEFYRHRMPSRACWIAPPAAAKLATEAGVDMVIDKSLKIIQIFQGLKDRPNGRVMYDSDLAQTIAETHDALVFVGPEEHQRFAVRAKTIVTKAIEMYAGIPLPRIVTYDRKSKKSGFGLTLATAKVTMMGGRQDMATYVESGTTAKEIREIALNGWKTPICSLKEDASEVSVSPLEAALEGEVKDTVEAEFGS